MSRRFPVGGLADRVGHGRVCSRVEHIRKDLPVRREFSHSVGGCEQHLPREPAGPGIERAPEEAGKAQGVVDTASIGGKGRTGFQCVSGRDFRLGIGQGKNDLARLDGGRSNEILDPGGCNHD